MCVLLMYNIEPTLCDKPNIVYLSLKCLQDLQPLEGLTFLEKHLNWTKQPQSDDVTGLQLHRNAIVFRLFGREIVQGIGIYSHICWDYIVFCDLNMLNQKLITGDGIF